MRNNTLESTFKKTIYLLRERKIQFLLSACLFFLLLGFGYLHATKGIDLTDEGMYLSTSMRYSLGDVPFRDEIMNVMRPFDVLTSVVFRVYPDISLLQMRCLGLFIHIISYTILFLFLSRYAPPFFVALACSVMFLINNVYGIMSPSYNLLSSDFSLIAMTLWLSACVLVRKYYRILFSVLAGFFLSLSVLSYFPLVLLICIPLVIIASGFFFSEKRFVFFQPSVTFTGTFIGLMILALIIIVSSGLLPNFVESLLLATSTTQLASTPWVKIINLLRDIWYAMPNGLIVSCVLLFTLFIIPWRNRKKFGLFYGIISIIIILVTFYSMLSRAITKTIISFSLILGLASFFLNYKGDSKLSNDIRWIITRNLGLIWGFISFGLYGVSSGKIYIACLLGLSPIFIFGMVALYHFLNHLVIFRYTSSIKRLMWPAIVFLMIIPFLIAALNYNYNYIYREVEIEKLTSRFNHPKLKGIYSTPGKVFALEELLNYLQGKVKPGDYFLAYNYIPMLYFLTHTRPAYGAAWARDDWPISIRTNLVKKMIENNRIPPYCVRMLAYPWDNWNVGMPYKKDSPLDTFINSHYYLKKIIYPFEIWHFGYGPKLREFDKKRPNYESFFLNWDGPNTIKMSELSKIIPSLTIQGFRGDFIFSRMPDKDGNIIRVYSFQPGQNGKREIQFGYTLKENGFNLKLHPGQNLILIISARLSNETGKPASIFIQDKTETWERNSTAINQGLWNEYIVAKRIRERATSVSLGIYWKPESETNWLEIKHARVYVED